MIHFIRLAISISLVFLLFTLTGRAQSKIIYSKAKVRLSSEMTLKKLAGLGVETDHGQYKESLYFISGFSQKEIVRMQNAGFEVEILVPDVVKDFQERNNKIKPVINQTEAFADFCNKVKTYKIPKNWKLGSMGGHLLYEEMLEHLDSMKIKFPNLISARAAIDTTKTVEGRTIWHVKISDNPNTSEPTEPQGLFSAVHHAREPVGMHQLIFYMWYLLENYATDPNIKALVDNSELYFVPCLNVDGYIFNQTEEPNGGGMWRKNRKDNDDGTVGIDLNRNYGYNWGYDDFGSSPDPDMETYRGPEGFSEPETRAMKAFCEKHKFKTGLNYHTYSNLVIHPWGYDNLQCPDSTLFRNLTREMTKENNYRIGTGMQVLNYNSNGSSDDFMYAATPEKPKILAMTPEVGDWFWPLQNEILDLCIENLHQNLTVTRALQPMAMVLDSTGLFLSSSPHAVGGYRLRYKIIRTAVNEDPASFTVKFTPFGPNSAGLPTLTKVYSNLAPNQTIVDSLPIVTGNAVVDEPNRFNWEISVDNGMFKTKDTVTHVGSPTSIFPTHLENCDNLSNWAGNWVKVTSGQHEGTGCLKQSVGDYEPNTDEYMFRKRPFDLRDVTGATIMAAEMSFWTKFAIEKNYDYASLEFSTDSGATWSTVCTDKSVLSSPFTQQTGQGNIIPIWDGFQTSWRKEYVDLKDYIGKKLWMRFFFHSDQGSEFAGFQIDDIQVKVAGTFALIETKEVKQSGKAPFTMYPNPGGKRIQFQIAGLANGHKADVQILDAPGRIVQKFTITDNLPNEQILDLAKGCYFVKLRTDDGQFAEQKLLIE